MSGIAAADAKNQRRRHHSVSTPIDRLIISVAQRFGGDKAKELERFIKFAFVGLLGFVIDSGTVIILQNSLLPPVTAANEPLDANVALATTVAFVLAVCSNFVWNRPVDLSRFAFAVCALTADSVFHRQRHRLVAAHAVDRFFLSGAGRA